MDSVLNCLVTDRLAPGDYGDRFLKTAREKLSFDYGVLARSPITALDLAFECLGLAAGDAVALSALSGAWACRALAIRGLKPVWLDVDQATGAIGPDSAERIASGGAKALYLAEPWGIMPDPALIAGLGVQVVEDATASLGASYGEARAGTLGSLCLVGLEQANVITAGGGALLFAMARRDAQALRNVAERLLPEERMSDMNAALALSQIKDMDKFLAKRHELFELYAQSLARSRKRPLGQEGEGVNAHAGCVVVLESGVKDVRAYAHKKDVDTALAFDDTAVANGFVPEGACPQAASLANRAVAFPLHPRIGLSAAQKVAKVLATLP